MVQTDFANKDQTMANLLDCWPYAMMTKRSMMMVTVNLINFVDDMSSNGVQHVNVGHRLM